VSGAGARGAREVRSAAAIVWPLLQATAAATVAWVIAKHGLGHEDPFFAPIAAVIALNTSLGERGLNALRLVEGVIVGIVAGELTLVAVGRGPGSLALAAFAAMTVARALGGARIVIAQAAVGAILIIALGDAEAGPLRLIDALIGAGVALGFSQILFSPEPVALVRRAASDVLKKIAEGLELTALALEHDDDELGERAMSSLRDLPARMVELRRVTHASRRVVRHSVVWRARTAPVVRETENVGHLDLLGGSCLTLARAAMVMSPAERRWLAPSVRVLAGAMADLAGDPGDRATRQRAADHALNLARRVAGHDAPSQSQLAAAIVIVRIVAADVMVFAGVDPAQAADVVREGTGDLSVPDPPSLPSSPLGPRRWRRP
jgi:hypothetical protein